MKKAEKIQTIDAWLSMQLLNTTISATGEREEKEHVDTTSEDTGEDTDSSDIVIHEIGESEDNEDSDDEDD